MTAKRKTNGAVAAAVAVCCVICAALLIGCGQLPRGIVLPEAERLSGVRVTDSLGRSAVYEDTLWIEELLRALGGSAPTGKPSVSDAPASAETVRIDFIFEQGGESTLFVYPARGCVWVEQPYAGIWLAGDSVGGILAIEP